MFLPIRTHIHTMVDTLARMFRFLWDGVGEVTAIATGIMAGIAMAGIGGIRDGIGKRALALP